MQIILPNLKGVYCFESLCFRYSYFLYFIIPLILIFLFIIRKNSVKFKNDREQESYIASRRPLKILLMITRTLILTAILIAMATPFIVREEIINGEPSLLILADNSSSFELFSQDTADQLYNEIGARIKVDLRHISSGEISAIGDGILKNMQGDDNLLLITDGFSNSGKLLGDVVSFASGLNTTIYTLDIKPSKDDVGISIEGPSQAIIDSDESFNVIVKNIGREISYTLDLLIDSKSVQIAKGKGTASYPLQWKFEAGYHTITAKLSGMSPDDFFPQNNVFYKTVRVVERPVILFVSEKPSPLLESLKKFYLVDSVNSLPTDLSKYLAVIINDIHAEKLNSKLEQITSYVSDGNGLIVIGGENSYERGNYKGSLFETLLPVKTGVSEESEKSDVNIVIVIDISQGTSDYVSIEKALALSVIDSVGQENNVGAVAFNQASFIIEPIRQLSEHYDSLVDKISRLKFDQQSRFDLGVKGGGTLLRDTSGSKNIILITDGKTTYSPLRGWTIDAVTAMAGMGIKTYIVGVGERKDDEFLQNLAVAGQGVYFPADASNKLKILFGQPNNKEEIELYNKLVILESTHFITFNTTLSAAVNGYNLVIPKPYARPLIITSRNIPILVVSRFGLGRVVSIATDDGSKWAGEMLNKENSRLITKAINWAIGDLTRKNEFDVIIKDTTVDDEIEVTVLSKEPPKSELFFVKSDANTYIASVKPNSTGFNELLNAKYAVNYAEEYKELGMSREFLDLVVNNGGEVFNPSDTERIISTIRQVSKRIKTREVDYRYVAVVFAILLFLTEIAIRRVLENKMAMSKS